MDNENNRAGAAGAAGGGDLIVQEMLQNMRDLRETQNKIAANVKVIEGKTDRLLDHWFGHELFVAAALSVGIFICTGLAMKIKNL